MDGQREVSAPTCTAGRDRPPHLLPAPDGPLPPTPLNSEIEATLPSPLPNSYEKLRCVTCRIRLALDPVGRAPPHSLNWFEDRRFRTTPHGLSRHRPASCRTARQPVTQCTLWSVPSGVPALLTPARGVLPVVGPPNGSALRRLRSSALGVSIMFNSLSALRGGRGARSSPAPLLPAVRAVFGHCPAKFLS